MSLLSPELPPALPLQGYEDKLDEMSDQLDAMGKTESMGEKKINMGGEQLHAYTTNLNLNAKAILHQKIGMKNKQITWQIYLERPPPEGWEHRWKVAHGMQHVGVQSLIVGCIIANSVGIGIEEDHGGNKDVWLGVETFFLGIFTLELSLNLYGFGLTFFTDNWHKMDALIVVTSIIDFIVTMAGSGVSIIRFSFSSSFF